jgi:hypothetical protein
MWTRQSAETYVIRFVSGHGFSCAAKVNPGFGLQPLRNFFAGAEALFSWRALSARLEVVP